MANPTQNPNYRIYGERHEKQIFREFKGNLENIDHTNWIARIDDTKKKLGWPRDLSYFVGYKIVKGFYENATDKKQAIQDLIDIKDPYDLLKKSKYEEYINGL